MTTEITTIKIPCPVCGGSGREEIPQGYDEACGRTLIDGEMVCENCNGKGQLNRSFIPAHLGEA